MLRPSQGHQVLVPELPSPHFQGECHARLPQPWQSEAGHKPVLSAPLTKRLGRVKMQRNPFRWSSPTEVLRAWQGVEGSWSQLLRDSSPPLSRIRGQSPGLSTTVQPEG